MQPDGLYYPFMRVRDSRWLKASALYWDTLYRFRPQDYRLKEPADARALEAAEFLLPLDPTPYTIGVARELLAFMSQNLPMMHQRFRIEHVALDSQQPAWGETRPGPASERYPGLAWIHISKMTGEFSQFMENEGLAVLGREHDWAWLGVHPTVASAYMLALTGASADREHLNPVTDTAALNLMPARGIEESIRLLNGQAGAVDAGRNSDVSPASFVMLAFDSVVPRDLSSITVDQIMHCRRTMKQELHKFRELVAEQQSDLALLADVRDDEVRARKFARHLDEKIKDPLENLEKGMHSFGWETVRALVTMQSVVPPLVAKEAVNYGAPPVVSAVGAVGLVLGNAWWQHRQATKGLVDQSRVGYLLSLKRQLGPRGVTKRVASMLA